MKNSKALSILSKWRSGPSVTAWLLAGFILVLNTLIWSITHPVYQAPDIQEPIMGLAYNGFTRYDSPLKGDSLRANAVEKDLALLSQYAPRIRTYSATDLPELLSIAEKYSLTVTLGAWLDRRSENNHREIQAAIQAAGKYAHIDRVIIGNETQLIRSVAPGFLYRELDKARRQLKIPVSTAEPWHVWLSQPELAKYVDFITVHLLPYWEGVDADRAVQIALDRLHQVQRRFPKIPIVIGEVGWPSYGPKLNDAEATRKNQAQFIRKFLLEAQAMQLDYYLMEAIDQPWKKASEGQAGGHWGLWDANRAMKFPLSGPISSDPDWFNKALLSSSLGILLFLIFFFRFSHLSISSRVSFGLISQGLISMGVYLLALPMASYLQGPDWLGYGVLSLGVFFLIAVGMSQAFEFAEVFFKNSLTKQLQIPASTADTSRPFISIHLACSNEPAEMVIQTIQSLQCLNWDAYEIIVVDNNTKDASIWTPIAQFIDSCHDKRIKFIHIQVCPGFKAGALNIALGATNPAADWVAVIDADYQVDPEWLQCVAPLMDDPVTGFIQAPQAHREFGHSFLGQMMNAEYDGFFRIGMHHRHERNAIIQHGTMTVIRASLLRRLNGWSERCICEDSELGLRILALGYSGRYLDHVLGRGLIPEDFAAYRRQRKRWAQGAMQILKAHVTKFTISTSNLLTPGQKYHFLAGWLPWVGDALHLLFTLVVLVWTVLMLLLPQHFGSPIWIWAGLLSAFFLSRLVFTPLLYWKRVTKQPKEIFGASLLGLSLAHSVARGVLSGLFHRRAIFEVTQKRAGVVPVKPKALGAWHSAGSALWNIREECLLLTLLWTAIAGLLFMPKSAVATDDTLWIILLAIQSLPYWATFVVACISIIEQSSRRRGTLIPTKTEHTVNWASPRVARPALNPDVAAPSSVRPDS